MLRNPIAVAALLLVFASCSSQLRFSNSGSVSFKEIDAYGFNLAMVEILGSGTASAIVFSSTLKLKFDDTTFDISALKNAGVTEYGVVRGGNQHKMQSQYDFTATYRGENVFTDEGIAMLKSAVEADTDKALIDFESIQIPALKKLSCDLAPFIVGPSGPIAFTEAASVHGLEATVARQARAQAGSMIRRALAARSNAIRREIFQR